MTDWELKIIQGTSFRSHTVHDHRGVRRTPANPQKIGWGGTIGLYRWGSIFKIPRNTNHPKRKSILANIKNQNLVPEKEAVNKSTMIFE